MRDDHIPSDYAAALAKHEAAWAKQRAATTKKELRAANEALHEALAGLHENPHYQWLEDVRRDEMAAFEKRLSMQPRTVTGMSLGSNEEDPDDPYVSTAAYHSAGFDSDPDKPNIIILIDARRTSAAEALRLLKAAVAHIEEDGICVSIAPSPFKGSQDGVLFVDERPDGSLRAG